MKTTKNANLDNILLAVCSIDNAVDLRWLAERVRAYQVVYTPKLHGIAGGHEGYSGSEALRRADRALSAIVGSPDDLATLAIVVDMLYRLMEPQGAARGTVQLKTITKSYPQIDFKTGLPELDSAGNEIWEDFHYTYAYVRQYAGRGDASRKRGKLLSLYADQGMGRGSQGGCVAAALNNALITEDDILDAWHAGNGTRDGVIYTEFMDRCRTLLK